LTLPAGGVPGRNDPCPCGSGKKFKKCHLVTYERPRERFAYFGWDESPELAFGQSGQPIVDRDGVPIARHGPGKIARPEQIFTVTKYDRASGKEKVVNLVEGAAVPDLASYLATKFDAIVAVDTNTKTIGGNSISVAVAMECFVYFLSPFEVRIEFPRYLILPFKNCEAGQEEKRGWARVVKIVTGSPRYRSGERVALLTDHDLGNLRRYENREAPLYRNTYLPEGFKLIYTTADTGAQDVNQLVRICDKHAARILHELETTGTAEVHGGRFRLDDVTDARGPSDL